MEDTLTPQQRAFLDGLRAGDLAASGIAIQPSLTDASRQDLARFENFLKTHGHPNPQPDDLGLSVRRDALLSLLHYADERNCLILQNCFGFDRPPVVEFVEDPDRPIPPNWPRRVVKQVGRIVLLNKGNFEQSEGRSDEAFFNDDTVYRKADGTTEVFRNMNLDDQLSATDATAHSQNFRELYTAAPPSDHDSFVLGYLLPVGALLQVFTDATQSLGRADLLTIRWGLTNDAPGNFTLVIGTGDLLTESTMEFRLSTLHENINSVLSTLVACPPNRGCS